MARQTAADERCDPWLAQWLDAVASGRATMSQRVVSSIERHGGLAAARQAARRRGVHLLRLTDERGRQLIATSRLAFKVIC